MHQVLKAGQSMIGLQYGTNKGASQVSIFSEYSTKKERSMKKRAGNIFSEYATEKYQVFPLFRLVWLPMEPPGRSDQRVSFIQHLSSTFDTKLYSPWFWSGVIFHHIVIIFWHPNTSSKLYGEDWTSNQANKVFLSMEICQKVLLWIAKKQWRHSSLFCNCLFVCVYFSSIRWAFRFERCLNSNLGWCLSSTFCLGAIIKMSFKSVPFFQRQQL